MSVISSLLSSDDRSRHSGSPINDSMSVLRSKAKDLKSNASFGYNQLEKKRLTIFELCKAEINKLVYECNKHKEEQVLSVNVEEAVSFTDPKYYYWGRNIIEIAKEHDYYYRKQLPRAWFKIVFTVTDIEYALIFCLHHFGLSNDALALAGFIQNKNSAHDQSEGQAGAQSDPTFIYPPYKPFFFSISSEIQKDTISPSISGFIEDSINFTIHEIIRELG